jgi:flagellar biosynthesis/type III secretory pathway M-ring protein FliF/YscJ
MTFWAWLKRWWKVVVGAVGGAVVVGVGAFIAIGEYKRRTASARDALAVEKARRDVARLQGQRDELLRQDVRDEKEIALVDEQLEVNRKRIEEVRRRADVPAEELARELAELGY